MRQHVLYVASPGQLDAAASAMERLRAKPVPGEVSDRLHRCYELTHRMLGEMVLQINFVGDIEHVTPHMRHNPVDLMIYDERGEDGTEACLAMSRIRKDVRSLADLWGPDFLFPMSRAVVILADDAGNQHRAFELGRLRVRDVFVNPRSTAHVLRWIHEVLWHGIKREERIGIALSGGGLEGFLYQMGALHALSEAIHGRRDLLSADVISGVSSGSIAGAMLAGQVPFVEVIKSIQGKSDLLPPLSSRTIFDLAATDITRRILQQSVSWAGLDPKKWINKTIRSIPTGFFKGDKLEAYLRESIEAAGGTDRFSDLDRELYIGATDQDSFEHVIFGKAPWDGVRLSEAIRASCALPPVFVPKQINGRYFIDGQVTKTCNLEMVVDRGCRLVIIVNPLKPFSSATAGSTDREGGFFSVIQTVKALISTRFDGVLSHIADSHPDVDFLVFEPDEECAAAMSGSPMRYRIRTKVIRLAYKSTLRTLRERHHVYSVKLGKYGMLLRSPAELKELEKKLDDEVFKSVA